MAVHDYVISNGTGAAVRSDLNGALAAIVSQNSSATEPSPTYAYQRWADTTAGVMKMRNGANSAWISLYELDGTFLASDISLAAGSAAAPSLFFTGDTNTGIYSPGADQIGISANGTSRIVVNASGLDVAGTFRSTGIARLGTAQTTVLAYIGDPDTVGNKYIYFARTSALTDIVNIQGADAGVGIANIALQAGGGRVGIGATNPGSFTPGNLVVEAATTAGITISDSTGAGTASIAFSATSSFQNRAKINCTMSSQSLEFSTAGSERARIDSSGRLLVGTSSDQGTATLQIQGDSASGANWGKVFLRRGQAIGTIGGNVGSRLGQLDFGNQDGAVGATIMADSDATWGSGDYPSCLVFSTTADGASSPTERMKINNTGSFTVIGAVSAAGGTHTIRDSGSSPDTLRLYNNTDSNNTGNRFLICDAGASILRAEIRSNGGLANFSANNANLSDRNAKKDISLAADTWSCVKEWEIVNYRYKDQPDDADLNLGVIAQQVAESCPEVITVFQEAKEATETEPAKEERLGVKEQQMYWMAIKALQEAMERIEALEADVAALKGA